MLRLSCDRERRLVAIRASYAESRYLDDERPVVVLPLNRMLNAKDTRDDGLWTGAPFAIGGFPGLKASLSGDLAAGFKLMCAPHPKIATLRRVNSGGFAVGLPRRGHTGGRVVVDGRTQTASVVWTYGSPNAIPWRDLSFLDGTIGEVQGLLRQRGVVAEQPGLAGRAIEAGQARHSDCDDAGQRHSRRGPRLDERERGEHDEASPRGRLEVDLRDLSQGLTQQAGECGEDHGRGIVRQIPDVRETRRHRGWTESPRHALPCRYARRPVPPGPPTRQPLGRTPCRPSSSALSSPPSTPVFGAKIFGLDLFPRTVGPLSSVLMNRSSDKARHVGPLAQQARTGSSSS